LAKIASSILKEGPDILERRREIVEHSFGSIKQWMGQGAFLMEGLDKARAEFSMTALAYNLRRALERTRRRGDGGRRSHLRRPVCAGRPAV
jgi:hypothetical protein